MMCIITGERTVGAGLAPALIAILSTCLLFSCISSSAQKKPEKPPPLSYRGGHLNYTADDLGNRIPDFSYAGYMASEKPIPSVPVKIVVPVVKGDATGRIQSAIDYVSTLPADKDGVRGAVFLQKGVYSVSGGLVIAASGVVLRGSGRETVLYGAGTERETLIRIAGSNDKVSSPEIKISDIYVPVNAKTIHVGSPHSFKKDDLIIIRRPCTLKWITDLGTDDFGGGITALGWKPGQRDIYWDRKIISVDGDAITFDAPITTALDSTYGGGFISSYQWPGNISQVGIENIICRSAYDVKNPKDEAHRWMAITMENISDAWVRQVTFEHFAGSAVMVLETAKRITVEDCKSIAPVSEIGGQRRYSFITTGQQTLFQRCYAENGYHDFSVGFCAAGPNAFVQCHSSMPYSFSGAIDSWASGTLFDIVNVDGNALRFGNRGQDGQGAGWAAANSVLYQCTAAVVDCYNPPGANNWAFGTWAQFQGDGYWGESNNSIQPRSLFYAQLLERVGVDVMNRAHILQISTEASSSPSLKVAMELTAQSSKPAPTLLAWIDEASSREPIPVAFNGVKTVDQLGSRLTELQRTSYSMQVKNGWLVRGDEVLTGRRSDVQWWSGSVKPPALKEAKYHITRFIPGRIGKGLTDDLAAVTNEMTDKHIIGIEHNYALWYERRRDDHERIRRMDGDVWLPFYELPFARSGQGLAFDGLSKYDLTKYNPWYWSRLKKFADLADQKGLALIHQNYFQHNIIEAGAHYTDFPWRTANNINSTGFPEPPNYAGDKRIFMAEQFYDTTHVGRRAIHISYIRKCLDNFSANTGVIQLTGAEYTGPLHFVQFWLNTVGAWEKQKSKNALIGLSTTKDVQDAILSSSKYASVVDIIDIRYWHYQANGDAYAPLGGQNLAPRQHARLLNPKKSSFEQVYRSVKEYRDKYQGKAVMYSSDSEDQFGWAVFMAGGSLAAIPFISVPGFLSSASTMIPVASSGGKFVLANKKKECIIYNAFSGRVKHDLPASCHVRWIDAETGKLIKEEKFKNGVSELEVSSGGVVIWVTTSL